MAPEPPASGGRPPSGSARVLLGVGVVAIALVGVVAGLAAADLTGGKRTQEVAQTPTSDAPVTTGAPASEPPTTPTTEAVGSPASPAETSSSPTPPTSSPTTTPTTTPTSSSTTTTRPATTSTTVPRTQPTVVITQPTIPASINVVYSQDSGGALVVPRRGSSFIQLTNTGDEVGQWLLTPTTSGYQLSSSGGTLGPGQTLTVSVTDTLGRDHVGTVNALVSPGNRFVVKLRTP